MTLTFGDVFVASALGTASVLIGSVVMLYIMYCSATKSLKRQQECHSSSPCHSPCHSPKSSTLDDMTPETTVNDPGIDTDILNTIESKEQVKSVNESVDESKKSNHLDSKEKGNEEGIDDESISYEIAKLYQLDDKD
jgi:hypothetical protein